MNEGPLRDNESYIYHLLWRPLNLFHGYFPTLQSLGWKLRHSCRIENNVVQSVAMSNLCLRTFKCWFRQRTMPTVNLKGLKNSVFTVCFNPRSLSLIQWKSEKPSSFKGPSSRSKCHYCKLITVASCNAPLHHPLCLFLQSQEIFCSPIP